MSADDPPLTSGELEARAREAVPAPEAPEVATEPAAAVEPELPEDALIVLAARGMALFPGVVLPIAVGRARSVRAVQAAVRAQRPLGVLMQTDAEIEEPSSDDLHRVGTAAEIVRYLTAPDGSHHVIAQGLERFRVLEWLQTEPFLLARVEFLEESELDEESPQTEAAFRALKKAAREVLDLLPVKPEDLDQAIDNAESPSTLTDMVATFMDIPPEEKQTILETVDLSERMNRVIEKLGHLIQVLQISRDIHDRTRGKMDDAQREYYLREQLRQIETELGEGEAVEVAELRQAIAKAGMPEDVEAETLRELRRLERTPEASAEHGMIRTYLDWMVEVPWSQATQDDLDLERAERILDEDHHGLEKVKRRILEFLAVRKLNPAGKSPILGLVGPPGVGKTSLGRSIARALGREFVRISLGGVHDESEVRGHRRTYVGAMPGRIVQSLRKVGTNNPVFMLDEMDKLSASFQGDPSAALLEVLDPEQNDSFTDNYLGVPFDLSRVLFIGTANVLHQIPGPLRDRIEVIELSGYTEEEKLAIARKYLVGRQREANGLTGKQIAITVPALREIARHYTREAGVRNLEREIGATCRHVATRVARGDVERVTIRPADLAQILGPRRFDRDVALRTSVTGVATGLAWTAAGGEVLFIEAARMPGSGELILTGQLGDVMKESARAALSLLRGDAGDLGVEDTVFSSSDLHVHIPAGGIPKDGPSAGVALYTALASLLTGRRVRKDVAMTGEISLRGLVLPVGGITEKVLAAYRAGLKKVLLPAGNEKDLVDVPAHALEKLDVVPVERVEEVLEHVLTRR